MQASGDDDFRHVEVLLIENSHKDIQSVIELLRSAEVHCHLNVVGSGTEALDFLYQVEEHTEAVLPDFIMLNSDIQGGKGRELLNHLSNQPLLREIPIMLLIQSSCPKGCQKLGQDGTRFHLSKPFDPTQFSETMLASKSSWTFEKLPC